MGIIIGATLLAPMAVFLDYHSYYITQFVASERVGGNYIDDDQVLFGVTKYIYLSLYLIRFQRWSSLAKCSSLPFLPSMSYLSSLVFFSWQGLLAQGDPHQMETLKIMWALFQAPSHASLAGLHCWGNNCSNHPRHLIYDCCCRLWCCRHIFRVWILKLCFVPNFS